MSLLSLILIIVLLGVLVYFINRFVPMDSRFKGLVVIVAVVVAALLVLQAFGILDALSGVRVPRVN